MSERYHTYITAQLALAAKFERLAHDEERRLREDEQDQAEDWNGAEQDHPYPGLHDSAWDAWEDFAARKRLHLDNAMQASQMEAA